MSFMIGHDSEAFVLVNGKVDCAIGKIGGTKDKPLPVEGGALQEDNVLVEINVVPRPYEELELLIADTHKVWATAKEYIGDFELKASHEYTKEQLIGWGEQALEFGCDPDYNAWTGEMNTPPSPYTILRTASGHPHAGYDNPSKQRSEAIARLCDKYMGVPSVLLDTDTKRRELYGKAGCYRPKSYGMEYRTLSNFWLRSDDLMRWVFSNLKRAVDESTHVDDIISAKEGEAIQECINSNNVNMAKKLCKNLELPYVS